MVPARRENPVFSTDTSIVAFVESVMRKIAFWTQFSVNWQSYVPYNSQKMFIKISRNYMQLGKYYT